MKMPIIIRYHVKRSFAYLSNQLLRVVSSIIFLYINFFLVVALLQGASLRNTHMCYLAYSVIMTITTQLLGQNLESYIGQRIVSGSIALDLIKPYGFFRQMFSVYFAGVVTVACCEVVPLLLCSKYTLGIDLVALAGDSYIYFLISLTVSLAMMFFIELITGLLAFWVMQVFGLSLLKSSLINVLAGVSIPLAFYPEPIKSIVINLPFQTVFCTPILIFQNAPAPNSSLYLLLKKYFSYCNNALVLITEQVIWLGILAFIAMLIWNAAKRYLVIEGG